MIYMIFYEMLHMLRLFLRLPIEIYFHQEKESKIRKNKLCMTCITGTTSTTKRKISKISNWYN